MADDEFDLFNYQETVPAPAPEVSSAVPRLRHADYLQMSVGFLASLNPDALAVSVPVRRFKYQVTAAAFWRSERVRCRDIARTAVVVFFEHFENCFCDCADREALLARLHQLRTEKEQLEADIRKNEPELASTDDLFSELRSWDYAATSNPAYRRLLRKYERLQHALHQGSRLERIRHAGVADLCYLTVPEGLVAPDEIAAGWGLVYLKEDRSFELVREPETQPAVDAESRRFLAANIAIAATEAALFQSGVQKRGKTVSFRRPPKRRLKTL